MQDLNPILPFFLASSHLKSKIVTSKIVIKSKIVIIKSAFQSYKD